MLYGIMGAKFSGKDTFAKMIGDPYSINHFASSLKFICSKVFNLSMDLFTSPELKESPLYKPVIIDNYLSSLDEATNLTIKPVGLVAYTPRELLQYVGTEYVRASKDSYWVDSLLSTLTTAPNMIIPDTRFGNEVAAIRACGGRIVKIVRVDQRQDVDNHASETASTGVTPDLVLGCVTGKYWLQQLVADLLRADQWEEACLFDYRLNSRTYATVNSIKNHYYTV